MLVIRDSWGVIVFEHEDYAEVVKFGKSYKKEHNIPFIEVTKKSGGFYSFI